MNFTGGENFFQKVFSPVPLFSKTFKDFCNIAYSLLHAECPKGHSANDVFHCVERDVPVGVMFGFAE